MAMEDPQAMAVDPDHDEAYVSGKLSSGFPSIGENSPSGTLSLNTDTMGERRKAGSKGKDGVRKSVSPQPGHRRKHAHPSRHGGGSHGEISLGSAFSLPKTTSGSLPTPTTQLSQQINQMGLMSPLVSGGKRRLAERPDDMSPMSDTEGGSRSLTDPGYDSLSLGPSSLEHPNSLLKERGRTGGGGDGQQKKDTTVVIKPAGTERLQVEPPVPRERSESPGVPPVAESVEIMTAPTDTVTRQTEAAFKRTASNWERQRAKNPRLTEGPSTLHPPIKVRTIVTSRSKSKKLTAVGVPTERPGRSPLHSMEEVESRSSGTSPSHQASSAPVNFRNVEELSRSDRQPDMEVDPRNPQIAKVISLIRSTREKATFTGRLSPQPATAVSPSPSPINSLQSTRSVSPHSPRSPHTSLLNSSIASGEGGKLGVGRRREGEEEGEVKRQTALLQVSEAHLAILPDEDGDTPLHLSIIHENVRLTQYLVKLIVGVYMNLDIANNMRQTPLHLAIITRQPHIVQLLVQAGASVNFPDRKGNTALHLAATRRDMQVLQMLARATSPVPDFNCKNFAGLAPVHLATRESSIDVLKFLFQMGANKNAMDACSGRTALHYAVEAENFILVNFLLENGCNVNSATFSGNTPLHIAAGRRLKEIVALLMAYGANPALANGEGDFPTDLPASLLMQRARMSTH